MWLLAHQYEHEANLCLGQAARLDPKDVRWPYLLGVNLAVSHREQAIQEFRRAIGLRDHWPVAHLRLGELLLAQEEFDAAKQELDIAFQQDTNSSRACFDLSRWFLMRGDPSTSLQWAIRAARLAPESRPIHELLAAIHHRLGNRDEAAHELRLAEQSSPDELGWHDELAAKVLALRKDAGSYLELAQSLLHNRQFDEGIQILREGLRQSDRDVRLYVALAQVLNQLQRSEDVKALCQTAIKRHPDSAELRFQQGVSEFQSGKVADAERSFREAIRIKPDHAFAHYNLGHVLLTLDHLGEAETAFERAAALRPLLVLAHVNAARLQMKRGELLRAKGHLQEAARIAPDDAEVQKLLNAQSTRD
jgi:tetratricopeptide (TPR) repeat protein